MVKAIRDVERAMGDGVKRINEAERKNVLVARKSIVATKSLESGRKIEKNDLTIKRPGTGIEPKYLKSIIGMNIKSEIAKDEILKWEMIN